MSEFDIRDFEAPIAVRTLDIANDQLDGFDLGASADGTLYNAVYVVATNGGRPAATVTLKASSDGKVDATELQAGLAMITESHRAHIVAPAAKAASAGAAPRVTVVLAVVDGGAQAARCVDAILAGSYQDIEVVIVNNRPATTTLTLDPASAAATDARVRSIDEPLAGLSYARNRGASIARGELIAFTDDDVVPDFNWIAGLVEAFETNPGTSCVTGLILPLKLDTNAQALLESYAGFSKGIEQQVFNMQKNGSEPLFPYAAGRFGSGANIAMQADVFKAIGGFDDALGTGTPALGGEDIDMFIRLLIEEHQLVYEPAAMVWHEHPATDAMLERQVFCYGAGLISAITKQIVRGPKRLRLLRAIPKGFMLALSPTSEKNERKGDAFPKHLSLRELAGMAYGPIAYFKSARLESKQAPEPARVIADAMPGFTPAYVQELDLGQPIAAIDAPPRPDGEKYLRARLVVRLHRAPLGIVELPLTDGKASSEAIVAAIDKSQHSHISQHLEADGLSLATLGAEGLPFDGAPPCLVEVLPSSDDPFVTVIVCTRDRAESLARALRSILNVEYENFEVVLVDNAPTTNDTRTVIDEFADPRVRYVLEPIAGLSRARNRGLSESRGDIIAFTDDDVEVDSFWLRGLIHGFRHADGIGCVTGVIPTTALENESQQYFDDLVSWSEGFDRRMFDLHVHTDDNALYPYSAGMFGAGANFAMSREAALSVGMFDEALGAGAATRGGEDLDYFARVILGGWGLVYEPLALVWHYHRADNESLKNQIWGYGTGATAYGIKTAISFRHGPKITWLLAKYVVRRAKKDPALDPIDLGYGELRSIQMRGLYAGPFLYVKGRYAASKNPKIKMPRS